MSRRNALLVAGALAAGAAEVWLARRTALPGGILVRRYELLAEIAAWAAVSVVAIVCLLRLPKRTAVLLLVGLGIAVRLASISEKAPLSDDLYRYAWDGIVQEAGISPYRYAPNAPELLPLREPWLWPPKWALAEKQTHINRPGVRTIYPPVAEAWFWVEHQVVPLSARDRGYELAGLGLDLAVLAALLALLRRQGDPRWAAVYALAPLPALEAVQNAHVDALAVLLVMGVVALERRGHQSAAAAVLALATLVKVYPALLLPLLLRTSSRRIVPAVVPALAFVAVVALAYVPHVLTVGMDVIGYLPGYLREERYDEGSRYLVVGLTGLTGTAASVVVLLGIAAAGVWALRTRLSFPHAGAWLFAVVFLLLTPVQPWYALLLVALVVLSRAWLLLAVAAAAYPLFFATILDGPGPLVGRISYGIAALLAAVAAWLDLRRTRGRGAAAAGYVARDRHHAENVGTP